MLGRLDVLQVGLNSLDARNGFPHIFAPYAFLAFFRALVAVRFHLAAEGFEEPMGFFSKSLPLGRAGHGGNGRGARKSFGLSFDATRGRLARAVGPLFAGAGVVASRSGRAHSSPFASVRV